MTELQVKRPRNLVDSMLPRQFAGRSPQRLRNPLPAFPLLPPTLQSQVHLPHRCRNIRPALRWAVVRIRHRSTLSATISSGHARLPKAHIPPCPPRGPREIRGRVARGPPKNVTPASLCCLPASELSSILGPDGRLLWPRRAAAW